MSFYRPATADDFKKFDVEYSNFWHMDNATKSLIEEGNLRYAVKAVKQQTGLGLVECKNYCLSYHSYVCARNDFEQGKSVFVPY